MDYGFWLQLQRDCFGFPFFAMWNSIFIWSIFNYSEAANRCSMKCLFKNTSKNHWKISTMEFSFPAWNCNFTEEKHSFACVFVWLLPKFLENSFAEHLQETSSNLLFYCHIIYFNKVCACWNMFYSCNLCFHVKM